MKHTYSAGGVVLNKDGLVLVVNQNGNSWSLPKGHIDPGEEKLEAAIREIYEESGIKNLDLIKELESYERYRIGMDGGEDRSETKTIYMFLFTTEEEKLEPLDPGNPEARWVEKEKVAELLTHKKDKEFFLKIINDINQ
jgi:8-oxo-dGTP pyrophosphatase MutT (NUDIX family)